MRPTVSLREIDKGNGTFSYLGQRLPAVQSCWQRSTKNQGTGRGCTQTSKQFSGWQTLKEKVYIKPDDQGAAPPPPSTLQFSHMKKCQVRQVEMRSTVVNSIIKSQGVAKRISASVAHLHFYTLKPSVCSSSPPLKIQQWQIQNNIKYLHYSCSALTFCNMKWIIFNRVVG